MTALRKPSKPWKVHCPDGKGGHLCSTETYGDFLLAKGPRYVTCVRCIRLMRQREQKAGMLNGAKP